MLALVALREGRVDGCREGRIVELEAQIFGAGLARRLGPARAELDAAGADAVVRSLVVVAFDGSDAGLDAKRQGADFAGVDAVFAADEAADLCHDNLHSMDRCRPMRPRCGCQAASRTPRTDRPKRSGGRPEPGFLFREEGAGTAPGKKVGEAVARQRKACGKPRSIKAAGVAPAGEELGQSAGSAHLRWQFSV
ncbi:hypothetical protein K663_16215 [Sphingobium sp. MI1205]|nr:hypothetical protein K663_16215 [Sphingobium sp. MI1205]